MPVELTAEQFIKKLYELLPEGEPRLQRDKKVKGDEEYLGLPLASVFSLAKEFTFMPPAEIEKLLESSVYEIKVGGVSIMDWRARSKKTSEETRKELFDLYIRRHDRINNWMLVDRSAPYVVGGYLADKPRDILYRLARSDDPMERRTAIVSTYYFIRKGDLDDTFKIAEILVNDENDLVQKAVGGWIREAGKKDTARLLTFLDQYAAVMPRTMLRYAIEHLDRAQKDYYLGLKKNRRP